MTNENIITSTQNARIKAVCLLQQKSQERRRQGLFVVEGRRELMHCISQGYEVKEVYICPEILEAEDQKARSSKGEEAVRVGQLIEGLQVFTVSTLVYDKMAYRGGTEGIMAVVRTPQPPKGGEIQTPQPPKGGEIQTPPGGWGVILVIEGCEKPGNLGAMLRTADAAGVDAVIVCDPKADIYNPNLIRASMGGVFSVPIAVCSSEECIAYLKENGVKILTAQLQDSQLYYDMDMTVPTAIVMGTEDTGLTPQWREAADAHIRIPMLGILDSLNVSVSAAVLMYEAVRQRKKLKVEN